MRENLNVHHDRDMQVGSDLVDAPHFSRIQRQVKLEFTDAHRAVFQGLPENAL